MFIPNDYTQNYPFCRLQLGVETFEIQLFEPINYNSLKSAKLLSQQIRRYYKTLGTSVIKSPICPPSVLMLLVLSHLKTTNIC